MSVAIIAALPREIAGITRGFNPDANARSRGVYLYRVNGHVVVAAGMGASRVSLGVEAALAVVPTQTLISVGLAGACSAAVHPGALLHAAQIVESRTGERFVSDEAHGEVVLVSSDEIASASEKKRLHESYRASIVDMEAATVARLARAHGKKFQAIKGVSDAHDFEIVGLSRFADEQGQFRTLRFAAYTAARPHTWMAAAKLGRNSNKALNRLTDALLPLIK